ncbi:hypothetical protein GFS24_18665 [Chitinophaga sp. SYP-B3965]|uniref:hypothetical protein n=1 Tax=Chitinophaga sp. SYP-B3965 TaxID=2663120 RepID=UPI001299B12D|nr:hypothetical protein [Chitinophaga sp. SYP-B3965]MRG47152.1 hypothetical protein [Chitinophaga sp. SYP-B3965]
MNYLSPLQFRVLKYSAVPGLLMLYYFFVLREQFPSSNLMGQCLKAGFIGLIIGWEFLIRKDFKRFGIFIIGAALWYFLVMLAFNRLELGIRASFFNHWYQIFSFLAFWGMLLIRGILLKDKSFIKTGLLVMFIWNYGIGALNGLYFIIEIVLNAATDSPFPIFNYIGNFISGTHQFLLPCFYYIILYFVENYLNDVDSFRQKFHSKILVIGKGEYVFFYGILFMFLIGSATSMGQLVEAWEHIRYAGEDQISSYLVFIFYLLCPMLTIILSGYLIRNIMVARSLTINLHNGFLYYLHCLPFLNLIPVLIYSSQKAVHTTTTENAVAYIKRGDSKMANWIIVVGVIMSLYGLYQGYNMYQRVSYYKESPVFTLLVATVAIFQFVRLINFLMVRNSRKAVYVLFTINLLSVCVLLFGSLELISLRVGICYMSLYLLLEIFHPTLFGGDAEAIPAAAHSEE